ncbi:MAG: serine/threonine protein phosphatase PrpC [Planctomycetota bacterium]|jgi:serine/threonine protein phosphatase PrpC
MQTNQRVDVHGLSLRGREHDKNHDHFAIATLNKSMRLHQSNLTINDDSLVHGHNQGHLFLVADGIGAGPAPARASGTAVDSVVKYFLNEMPWYHLADGEPADVTLALEDALRNAQDELFSSVVKDKKGLGTAMTLAFVFWPHLYIAHVGDSRCYLKRERELRQLTTDHTLAEVRRRTGGRVSDRSNNVPWNTIGGRQDTIQPEVRHVLLEAGDVLALVTVGVARDESKDDLKALLDIDAPAEQSCGRIVGETGSGDRTAIVVRFLPNEQSHAKVAAAQPLSTLAATSELPQPLEAVEPCESPFRTRDDRQQLPRLNLDQ